jgi:hypothetical protein
MILTMKFQGSFETLKGIYGSAAETPEAFVKEHFDLANTDVPNILSNEPRSFTRTNNDVTVKFTLEEDQDL